MNIGSRIFNLRRVKNITQEELAEVMNVSRQAVSKWESDVSVPDIEKVIKLSEYFDTTIDYLLKGTEVKNTLHEDDKDVTVNVLRRKKNYPLIISLAISVVSGLSILTMWILSRIYALNDLPYNPQTEKYRVGFDAFTYVHGLKGFFALMVILFLIGVIVSIFIIRNLNKTRNTKK